MKQGEKVVITVGISNLDKEKSVNAIRLLFSNSSFLEEGLTIVNVMSGGQQNGRSFLWQNDNMKINPGEKRYFTIVARANKPGKYESVISIKDGNSSNDYSDPKGNCEMVAKLTVF